MDLACPTCGSEAPRDANFCATCGAELPGDSERTQSHPMVVVGSDEIPMVVVTRGPNAGSRFALGPGETRIGRHPDSEVFLDDVSVSRHHAVIARRGDLAVLRDVGSLNGTYVDGRRIDGETALAEGAQLQVGKFKLVFVMGAHGGDA